MKKTIVLPIIFLLSTTIIFSQGWETYDVGDGTKSGLALNANNDVYVAYMSEEIQGFVKVATMNNGIFSSEQTATGYFYGPLDIATDNNGYPRVVFHNHDSENLGYSEFHPVTGWNTSSVFSTGHDGWDGDITVDAQNNSLVSATDPGNGLEYYKQNGQSWTVDLISTGPLMYANATSIVLDPNGNPIIGYYNNNLDNLYIAEFDGTNWNISFITSSSRFPALKIDDQGNLSIAYYRELTATTGQIFLAQRINNNWIYEEVDSLTNVEIGFNGARKNIDLVLRDGSVHMAYCDRKAIRYAKRNSGTWYIEMVVNHNGDNTILGQQIGLELDDSGNPHMTYFEVDNGISEGGHVKYIHKTATQNLLVTCPQDITVYCSNSANSNITGEPLVLINPGNTTNISETDSKTNTFCSTGIDTILRTWIISNELGNSDTCYQNIYRTRINTTEIDFPQNMLINNICYDDIGILDFGEPQGLCGSASSSVVQERITQDCQDDVFLRRIWTITDTCIGVFHIDTQVIELHTYQKMDTINTVIIQDGGTGNGSISFEIECGYPGYTYFWNIGATANSVSNLDAGQYTVTVTDALGCTLVLNYQLNSSYGEYISGTVTDVNGHDVGVAVTAKHMDGNILDDCNSSTTPGSFAFCGSTAKDVELCFSKDDIASSGVSALDLVKATRIILGLVNACPYNLIAGDVNFSNDLTAADLFQMQRIILGIDEEFAVGVSWVYSHNFDRISCDIIFASEQPIAALEYVAIKLGDLACQDTSLFRSNIDLEERSITRLEFVIEDQLIFADQYYDIPVLLKENTKLSGAQWAITANTSKVEFSELTFLSSSGEYVQNLNKTKVKGLWYSETPHIFHSDDPMFHVRIFAHEEALLSQVLTLDDSFKNLSYDQNESETYISLNFIKPSAKESNISVFPNPFDETFVISGHEQEIHSIEMYTVKGELIFQSGVKDSFVRIPAHICTTAGLYVLKIYTDDAVVLKQVVKQ